MKTLRTALQERAVLRRDEATSLKAISGQPTGLGHDAGGTRTPDGHQRLLGLSEESSPESQLQEA